jgi:hypothetical protein
MELDPLLKKELHNFTLSTKERALIEAITFLIKQKDTETSEVSKDAVQRSITLLEALIETLKTQKL